MAKKTIINPAKLGETVGPFARAVRVGNHLYITGTSALTQESGDYYKRKIASTIEEQTRQTLENLKTVMEAAGGTLNDIVKIIIILKNQDDYKRMNAIRAEYFKDSALASCTFSADLIRDDVLIEIEAEAVLD